MSMFVDIYVQKDGTALVVPHDCDLTTLSDRGKDLVASACKKVLNLDIDGSIIGLNRDAAKKAISEHGEFVSERATVTWCEHS